MKLGLKQSSQLVYLILHVGVLDDRLAEIDCGE